MVYVVKEMTKQFRHQNSLVVADSAFESIEIMEWGRKPENQIAYVMTYGGNKVCHPEYFRSKTSKINKHMKEKEKRGAMFVTHWDCGTFTTSLDSALFRLVDNDLDWTRMTSRVVRQFDKSKKKGQGRWKGLGKVFLSSATLEVFTFEIKVTPPVHFFKTYYGRIDAINSILATCGMDRKSRRKTFRVPSYFYNFIEIFSRKKGTQIPSPPEPTPTNTNKFDFSL